jgi:hypothetical protein
LLAFSVDVAVKVCGPGARLFNVIVADPELSAMVALPPEILPTGIEEPLSVNVTDVGDAPLTEAVTATVVPFCVGVPMDVVVAPATYALRYRFRVWPEACGMLTTQLSKPVKPGAGV